MITNYTTFSGAIALIAARAAVGYGPRLAAILSVLARWTMRITVTLVIALAFAASLSSCKSIAYRKVKRQMSSIQSTLQKYPELADTLNWNKPTVLTALEFRDSLVYKPQVDTAKIDSLANLLYMVSKINSAKNYPPREVIREKLIRAACPEVQKDTVFHLSLTVNDTTVNLSLSVGFNSLKGLTVHVPETKYTVSENKTAINFTKPDPPFYAISWFWAFIGVSLVLIIVVIKK